MNIIKVLELASGKFDFALSDEDLVDMDSIPKIIKFINENVDVSLILGKFLNQDKEDYINYDKKRLSKRSEAIKEVSYTHSYTSGIICNKNI